MYIEKILPTDEDTFILWYQVCINSQSWKYSTFDILTNSLFDF